MAAAQWRHLNWFLKDTGQKPNNIRPYTSGHKNDNIFRTSAKFSVKLQEKNTETLDFYTERLDFLHVMEVLFPEYFGVFLEYFHTMENISILWKWTKLWKLNFPTFVLQYFHNTSSLWKRYNLFSVTKKQYIYLLLTECTVRTVGYGPSFLNEDP